MIIWKMPMQGSRCPHTELVLQQNTNRIKIIIKTGTQQTNHPPKSSFLSFHGCGKNTLSLLQNPIKQMSFAACPEGHQIQTNILTTAQLLRRVAESSSLPAFCGTWKDVSLPCLSHDSVNTSASCKKKGSCGNMSIVIALLCFRSLKRQQSLNPYIILGQ